MPTVRSPPNASPDADGGGDKEGAGENIGNTPEWVSRVLTRSSLSSDSAAAGAPRSSSAASRKSYKGDESEGVDVGSQAVSDTDYHQHLLQRPSSSTDIAGLTSSLLLHELSTISSGAATSRTTVRHGAGGSIVVSGLASISSQTVTTVVPEAFRGSIGTLSSCRRIERQVRGNVRSTVTVKNSAAAVLTVASASALSPLCFSKKYQSVSSIGHPFHQPSSFWAGAAPLALSSTLLSEPRRRFSAPLPLGSRTRVAHEDAPDASAAAAVAYMRAEDWPESAETAAVSIARGHPAVEKERMRCADTLGDAVERGTAESATAQNLPKGEYNRNDASAHVTARQSPALSMRRGADSSSARTPRCFPAEDDPWHEIASQHVRGGDNRSSDSKLFSPAAALYVQLARYAASNAEGRTRPRERSGNRGDPRSCGDRRSGSRSRGGSRENEPEERLPKNDRSSDFHGAARWRDGDVGCLTMSSLVDHVAVPSTVQAVLRNSNATKKELWMALRTACQQCEVLQRRLARAEGALGSEEESEMERNEEGVADEWDALTNVTAHQRWSGDANKTSKRASRRHTDEEETTAANGVSTVECASKAESGTATTHSASAQMHSSTALTAHTQPNCQCNPGHRMRRYMAGIAATATAAEAASTAPVPACAMSSGNANSNARCPPFRCGGGSSDASSVLRDRVSELIRRVEAERKAQPHAPQARHSHVRHPRADSSGLDGLASSRAAIGVTLNSDNNPYISPSSPPLPDSHGSRRSTPPSDGQTARVDQKPSLMESRSHSSSVSECTASSHASNSESAGSVCETFAPGSNGIHAPPTLPAIAGVEAQAPVARRSYNPTERGQLAPPPPPLHSSKAGGVGDDLGRGTGMESPLQQQRQSHRRPHGASSGSLESGPAMMDESVHSNGLDAAAESLTALPDTPVSTPLSWASNGLQMSVNGCRGVSCLRGSPRTDCSYALPNTTRHQSGWAVPTCVNSASTAVIAGAATSLSGTLPSLHSSTLSGRPAPLLSPLRSGASISSVESARLRQPQQQHAISKAHVSKAAALRVADDADQKQTLMSPRSRSPSIAALSPTSAALEMLWQLQHEDAPVPPVTRDDQKAALRQWRREAALMKANGTARMC